MIEAWNAFFHVPADALPVALFRIGLGVILVIDAILYARDAHLFLHPDSLHSHELYFRRHARRLSLFRYIPRSPRSTWLVLAIYLTSALCLTVGLFTPWMAGIAFVSLLSIQGRSGPVLHSGDTLVRLMLFLLIFSEAGRALSIDSSLSPESSAEDGSPWAHRLMQIQFSAVYVHTVLWKLKGKTWRDGTAVYFATQFLTHQRHQIPGVLRRPIVYRTLTYGTIVVESAIGVLIWFDPFVYWVIGAGILFHLGLDFFMHMHLFQWTMIVSMTLFIPAQDIRRFLRLLG